jgi:phosphate/phosphite/phosphonate ABC transporter binding protein
MDGPLRFGIAPGTWDVDTESRLRGFCEALSNEAGIGVLPYATSDYRGVVSALERGEIDMAWLPPVVALRGVARGALVPLILPVRGGSSSFTAVLFTRAGSALRAPADLDGNSVAWVDRQSASGYLVIRTALVHEGVDLSRAFSHEEFAGTHPRVAHAVLSGRIDLGATFATFRDDGSLVVAGWSTLASEQDVQIVTSIGPIPADVVAMNVRTPPALGRAVQRAVLEASIGTPLFHAACALFGADAFEVPRGPHLAPLARLLDGMSDSRRFSSVPPGRAE